MSKFFTHSCIDNKDTRLEICFGNLDNIVWASNWSHSLDKPKQEFDQIATSMIQSLKKVIDKVNSI